MTKSRGQEHGKTFLASLESLVNLYDGNLDSTPYALIRFESTDVAKLPGLTASRDLRCFVEEPFGRLSSDSCSNTSGWFPQISLFHTPHSSDSGHAELQGLLRDCFSPYSASQVDKPQTLAAMLVLTPHRALSLLDASICGSNSVEVPHMVWIGFFQLPIHLEKLVVF